MIDLPSGHNLNGDLSFTQERPHNLPVHLANDSDWEWIKCDKLDDRIKFREDRNGAIGPLGDSITVMVIRDEVMWNGIKRGRQHVKDWLSGKYKGAVNGA